MTIDLEDPRLYAWQVRDGEYPAAGDEAEKLRFLVRYALLAPSGHNAQPWKFRIDGDTIELLADRTRALPVVDPDDRELAISCGAALRTLQVALRRFGHRPVLDLLPDPAQDDLLARITVAEGDPPGDLEMELFDAIRGRHTNRQAFEDREVPGDLVGGLVAGAEAAGVSLHILGENDREPVADLIAEGDRLQMSSKGFRNELAAWVHPNTSHSQDGMRGYGFGFGDLTSHIGPFVIRTFDTGKGQAAKDRELAEGSPLLAVLVTDNDDPRSWLATGQALQTVLLKATVGEVCASFLNQPIEVVALRPRLAEQIGEVGRFPQLLLRFGFGPGVSPQPRRDLEQALASVAIS